MATHTLCSSGFVRARSPLDDEIPCSRVPQPITPSLNRTPPDYSKVMGKKAKARVSASA